jgi:hypothetical protein
MAPPLGPLYCTRRGQLHTRCGSVRAAPHVRLGPGTGAGADAALARAALDADLAVELHMCLRPLLTSTRCRTCGIRPCLLVAAIVGLVVALPAGPFDGLAPVPPRKIPTRVCLRQWCGLDPPRRDGSLCFGVGWGRYPTRRTMRGGSRPDHRRTHQTLRGNLQTNSPSRYWTTKVSPARCACPNPSNRLDVRRSCLASKKTILEADEQPRAQTATEEPCLWVPEGNLAGICWVGLWGLGGPWGL